VIISTGSGSIFTTIQFSRYAESKGADCLMVLPPRITPLSLKELIRFYERVADSVSIPIMIQDADFAGPGIPPKVYADLSKRLSNLEFAKLVGEVLQKWRDIGPFRPCGFGSRTVGGGPFDNCFTLSANSGTGV